MNTLVIANTLFIQHKRRLYTWTSPDGQHRDQTDYILCTQRWRSSIQSAKTRLGADCGSDHELLIAKFRLKLKKMGKTTKPFRYDLNQIPYDYTVEVRNWSIKPKLKTLEYIFQNSYIKGRDIFMASSDSHFSFLHFFSMGMVLIPVSCTMSRTSFHSSSLYLSDLGP